MITQSNTKHHTCACLGRSFTFDEWVEYLRHHHSSEPVYEHEGFHYNIHDVCLDPKVCINWESGPQYQHGCHYSITVRAARKPEGWTASYIMTCCNLHSGPGTVTFGATPHPTMKEAVHSCLADIVGKVQAEVARAKRCPPTSVMARELPNIQAMLRQAVYFADCWDPRQLELF